MQTVDDVSELSKVLDALPDPVLVIDAAARLVWANRAAVDWAGWQLDDFAGKPVDGLVHPDDLVTAVTSLASVQHKTVGSVVELRFRDRAGEYHRFEIRGRAVPDRPDHIVLVLRDVTDRRRWELAAGDTALLQVVLDHAPGITMLLDAAGRVRGASRALSTLLGCDIEAALGRHLAELATDADADAVRDGLAAAARTAGTTRFEADFAHCDGRRAIPLGITTVNLLDDVAVQGIVVSAVDISALVDARARLEHLASHDPLTALPNRALLLDRLEHALAVARRRRSTVGVLFGDLDGFKAVNDGHGHRAGDWVLLEVSRRLTAAVRSSDTVARLGGDEFVVVVEDEDGPGIQALARRVAARVAEPIVLPSGKTVVVRISTGAVVADPDASVEETLAMADRAMYAVKRTNVG